MRYENVEGEKICREYFHQSIKPVILEKRKAFENAVFRFNGAPSHEAFLNYYLEKAGSRPKYGALAFEEKEGVVKGYGDVALYLKDETKSNMIFTAYDSGYRCRRKPLSID